MFAPFLSGIFCQMSSFSPLVAYHFCCLFYLPSGKLSIKKKIISFDTMQLLSPYFNTLKWQEQKKQKFVWNRAIGAEFVLLNKNECTLKVCKKMYWQTVQGKTNV